jgi:hypothetical protein
MTRLTTRQIVILGIMLLAILYGAYELLSNGRKKPAAADPAKKTADLNAFISEMTTALAKDTPTAAEAHMIKRAEAAWARDPFYERKTYAEWSPAKEPAQPSGASAPGVPKVQFNYTGFVDGGGKRIAVVNGNEYGTGDALDVEGYVLKAITPSRISVYNRETRRTFEIPLQE